MVDQRNDVILQGEFGPPSDWDCLGAVVATGDLVVEGTGRIGIVADRPTSTLSCQAGQNLPGGRRF